MANRHPKRKLSPEYYAHLESAEWLALRDFCIETRGYRCEKCKRSPRILDLHHLHYKTFGREQPIDVQLLCRTCHTKVERAKRKRRPFFVVRLVRWAVSLWYSRSMDSSFALGPRIYCNIQSFDLAITLLSAAEREAAAQQKWKDEAKYKKAKLELQAMRAVLRTRWRQGQSIELVYQEQGTAR
jgi:hypothetical protein